MFAARVVCGLSAFAGRSTHTIASSVGGFVFSLAGHGFDGGFACVTHWLFLSGRMAGYW
jgi:hypothetical protein